MRRKEEVEEEQQEHPRQAEVVEAQQGPHPLAAGEGEEAQHLAEEVVVVGRPTGFLQSQARSQSGVTRGRVQVEVEQRGFPGPE